MLKGRSEYLKSFVENYDEIAPDLFLYDRDGEKSINIGQELKKVYLPSGDINEGAFGGLNMV